MTTNNGKVISALGSSSGRVTGIHAGSNGKVIEDRVRSKPGATAMHAGSNGKVIEDRARSKPGATAMHAGSNGKVIEDRARSKPGAIDARVGRTRGVSVITDNAFRRARTRRSTRSLTDVLGCKGEMARFASD